ncbi:hypothetical protein L1987_67228 [Smallanthus sonchifolius]|uniref:Uncharacterized protein n=1 Tax=Smallanthus sonchifolius TaxID=185202 RepID=A0ACB9BZB6_9ASTR|nr:hypothetical protein L1987_67228 [Smallanthus sonchifolius]
MGSTSAPTNPKCTEKPGTRYKALTNWKWYQVADISSDDDDDDNSDDELKDTGDSLELVKKRFTCDGQTHLGSVRHEAARNDASAGKLTLASRRHLFPLQPESHKDALSGGSLTEVPKDYLFFVDNSKGMNGRYEGDWVDQKYDAYGVETWAKGSGCRGGWIKGQCMGMGFIHVKMAACIQRWSETWAWSLLLQVRELGRILDVPVAFLKRHSFPGQGLADRIPGDVTKGNASDVLRLVRHGKALIKLLHLLAFEESKLLVAVLSIIDEHRNIHLHMYKDK